ncbi:Probable prolyl 4-hydroxylase 11 [Striga hermonthica]|uniref:Probable prolyl 4-hydroxylase 11 n=1 Tax=Striga hermonthica TaxID=68872 RepID=A0A9N7NKP4_STRHE|nr:Probable prolyl 4-hydroxylase 11 [Striga hermonthica]
MITAATRSRSRDNATTPSAQPASCDAWPASGDLRNNPASPTLTIPAPSNQDDFDMLLLLWQTRVKDLLAQQGIQKGLRAEKPKGMEDDDWQDLQERAAGMIRLCLADEVMYHIMHLKLADEIWKKLESQFMSKTLTTKLYLKQRLYGLKMQEGTDLGQHVNIFNQVVTDLASLEVKIEDEDKAMILLCSLPPSYEHMVTTLSYGKETIKTEEITSALLAHNQQKQKSGESSSQSDSLYVKGNQDRGRRQGRDNSGNWNFRSKSREKSQGRKTVTCYKCKEQGDGDMLSISTAQYDDAWILDCGCSYHIMPTKEWFAIYEPAVLDKGESSSSAPDDVDHDVFGPTDVPESYKLARDRVRRTNIQAPVRFGYEDMVAFALTLTSVDPCTFQEAVSCENNDRRKAAMEEEMNSVHKNQTWELDVLPEGKRAIGSKED